MQVVQGSLMILNPHSTEPQVFWNGVLVEGVKRLDIQAHPVRSRVMMVLEGAAEEMVVALRDAGVAVSVRRI